MKLELKISKEMFTTILSDMTDKSVDDYYGKDHPCGWGYKIEEDSASYTTCRENTHGVKNVDGEFIAFIDGRRSTINSLGWYWEDREILHNLEVVKIETANPDMYWHEDACQYLVRQGEAYALTCIPALSEFGLKEINKKDMLNSIVGELPSTLIDALHTLDVDIKEALVRASGTSDVLERRFWYKRENSALFNAGMLM